MLTANRKEDRFLAPWSVWLLEKYVQMSVTGGCKCIVPSFMTKALIIISSAGHSSVSSVVVTACMFRLCWENYAHVNVFFLSPASMHDCFKRKACKCFCNEALECMTVLGGYFETVACD